MAESHAAAFLLIGPFSRASSLSVKALRAYHDSGLLVPAVVDPRTGYRSYSVAQLTDAAVIRRLRDLDVSLVDIKQILDARDPDVTRKVLREHGSVLEERLATTQRAIDDLYAALAEPESHTPVHRRFEPARTVLAVVAEVVEPNWLPFFARAVPALFDTLAASGAVATGPVSGCFPAVFDEEPHEVMAYMPIAAPVLLPDEARAAGVTLRELPATEVAVIVYDGPLTTLHDAYTALGAWVAANAQPRELPVREIYSDDGEQLRTEIQWPVMSRD
jgi:DNA-binding transcriptional MerR regulator/effector-binding domain-containing protein